MKKLLTLCMSVLIAMQLFPCRAVIADPLAPEEDEAEENELDDGNATDSLVPEEDVTEEDESDGGNATEPLAVEESKAEAKDVIEEDQIEVESSVSLQADPKKEPEKDNRTVAIEDGPKVVSLGTGASIDNGNINITQQTFLDQAANRPAEGGHGDLSAGLP